MSFMPDPMQNAYRLIRDGRHVDAQQLLLPIVRDDPSNADAWWLLANALQNGSKAEYALQQVLSLRPDDERARKMLERLRVNDGSVGSSPFPNAASPVQSMPTADDFSRDLGSLGKASRKPHPLEIPPVAGSASSSDDFSVFEKPPRSANDPFAGVKLKNDSSTFTPTYVPPRRPASGNPCVIFLAIIGAITLFGCAVCSVLTLTSAGTVSEIVQGLSGTFEADPQFRQFLESGDSSVDQAWVNSRLPTGLDAGGELIYGDSRNADLTTDDEYYTFMGNAGDSVIITLDDVSISGGFDPLLKLYNPEDRQIAQDDDGGDDLNARITYTLTATGKYTIVVSRFSGEDGGNYVLALRLEGAPRNDA